jgi:hypothetical protein
MKLAQFLLILLSANAFSENQPWQTKARCGDQKVAYYVNCKAATRDGELNECNPKSQTLQQGDTKISLPHFSKKEIVQYRKAGTDDGLFVRSWACVKHDERYYLRIHFESYGGHGEFDEKDDYFTTEGVVERTESNRQFISDLERAYFKDQDEGKRQFNLGEVFGRFKKK